MLDLQIATGSSVPIYRQIMDGFRQAIANGRLALGDQLPSVRALAERLLLNPNTVARAYGELAREGIIEPRHGRGVFVARRRQVYTKAERSRRLERAVEAMLAEALLLDFDRDEILESVNRKIDEMNGAGGKSGASEAEGGRR
jgi:GntR family transcriptional regulator